MAVCIHRHISRYYFVPHRISDFSQGKMKVYERFYCQVSFWPQTRRALFPRMSDISTYLEIAITIEALTEKCFMPCNWQTYFLKPTKIVHSLHILKSKWHFQKRVVSYLTTKGTRPLILIIFRESLVTDTHTGKRIFAEIMV